jgi:hypothetical protein
LAVGSHQLRSVLDSNDGGSPLMAIALHIDKMESDGTIRVRHTFYGETESECRKLCEQHGEGCKAFGPALEHHKVIVEVEEIDEIPEWEEE